MPFPSPHLKSPIHFLPRPICHSSDILPHPNNCLQLYRVNRPCLATLYGIDLRKWTDTRSEARVRPLFEIASSRSLCTWTHSANTPGKQNSITLHRLVLVYPEALLWRVSSLYPRTSKKPALSYVHLFRPLWREAVQWPARLHVLPADRIR